jgi:hypothetical protein
VSIVLQPLNATLKQCFDLTFDGLFPTGNKTPNLAWVPAQLPNLNSLPVNVATSFNARMALSGDPTAVAATTINVVFVSGATSAGWVSPGAGNTCSNPGPSTAAQGVFLLRATYFGLTIDSPPLTWSFIAASSGSGKFKFNPSVFYIELDQNTSFSTQLARMKSLKAANPQLRGVQVFWNWAALENPALVGGAAQYDGSWGSQTNVDQMGGFKLVQTFLDAAAAIGVQFMLHNYSYLGASAAGAQSTSFPSAFAPAYLAGSAYGPNTASSNGIFGGVWINSYTGNTVGKAGYYRYWVPAVMTRLIALATAYGNHFDSHPNLESTSWLDESAIDPQTSYSDAGAIGTMIGPGNYFQAIRAAWPTTQLRWLGNYLQSLGAIDQFLAAAFASKWNTGGPDTANESGPQFRSVDADWRARGLTAALGNGGVPASGVPNYTTMGAGNHRQVEGEDLSYDIVTNTTIGNTRHIGDGVCAHIVAQANLMKATHMVWFDNTFTGPNRNRTNTAHPNLLDFLSSAAQGGNVAVNGVTAGIALTTTTYPSSWP